METPEASLAIKWVLNCYVWLWVSLLNGNEIKDAMHFGKIANETATLVFIPKLSSRFSMLE